MEYNFIYDHQQGILSCNAGKVKVCYFENGEYLKVIRISDNGVVDENPFFNFTLKNFIESVNHYNRECNP